VSFLMQWEREFIGFHKLTRELLRKTTMSIILSEVSANDGVHVAPDDQDLRHFFRTASARNLKGNSAHYSGQSS